MKYIIKTSDETLKDAIDVHGNSYDSFLDSKEDAVKYAESESLTNYKIYEIKELK